jgi:hypothetical protein
MTTAQKPERKRRYQIDYNHPAIGRTAEIVWATSELHAVQIASHVFRQNGHEFDAKSSFVTLVPTAWAELKILLMALTVAFGGLYFLGIGVGAGIKLISAILNFLVNFIGG